MGDSLRQLLNPFADALPASTIVLGAGTASDCATLAEVQYGQAPASTPSWPVVELALPALDKAAHKEIWACGSPAQYLADAGVQLACSKELLFGHIAVPEANALQETVFNVYRRLFAAAQAKGYPHLLRIWNFFPAINEVEGGLERYRQFCVGRHQAFAERHADFQSLLPAATAVGTASGGVHVYFLAGTTPGHHFENPRQISAYRYPSVYGPRSPAFARATWHATTAGATLFIAGTSSIVGHLTQHAGDPYKQAQETLANIDAVVAQRPGLLAEHCAFRVYVRYPDQLATIRAAFRDWLGFTPPFRYVQGSICRADLLLEVEGVIAQKN